MDLVSEPMLPRGRVGFLHYQGSVDLNGVLYDPAKEAQSVSQKKD